VKSLTAYQWEDEPVRWRSTGSLAYAGWQSGLFYVDGRPKPAYSGFLSPLVVDRPRGARLAVVWGQVRPGGAHLVALERHTPAGWSPLATIQTAADGVFRRRLALHAGERLRVTWPDPDPAVAGRMASGSVIVGTSARGSRLASPTTAPPADAAAATPTSARPEVESRRTP
jgi:hypothetical protein